MNTRTAVLTLAFAALNIAALATSGPGSGPKPFVPGRLMVVTASGGAVVQAGALPAPLTGLPELVTGLDSPQDLAFAPDGSLCVSIAGSNRVLAFDGAGALRDSIGVGTGLSAPAGLAFGPGGRLYVASSGTDDVFEFDRDGDLLGQIGTGSGLVSPQGVALGPDGRLHVASAGTDSVFVFDLSGAVFSEIGAGGSLQSPHGLCFSGDGHLFVSSAGNDRVVEFDQHGVEVGTIGVGSALSGPAGITFGPDGFLYVASGDGSGVLAFSLDGNPQGGHVGPTAPRGLAFVPATFEASLKAELQQPGAKLAKLKSAARVSVDLGTQTVMVRLLTGGDPLAGLFGTDTWVLHGFASGESQAAKTFAWAGQERPAAAASGFTSMRLELKDTAGAGDGPSGGAVGSTLFTVRKFEGDFERAGPAAVASGSLKSGKPIVP